jgi:hypothetical protein
MTTESDNTNSWMGPRGALLDRLQTELESDRVAAEKLADELEQLHESLRPDFLAWITSNVVDLDREIQGWSIRKIIKSGRSRHVSPAFTWMSGLLTDTEQTLEMLVEPVCVVDSTPASADDMDEH